MTRPLIAVRTVRLVASLVALVVAMSLSSCSSAGESEAPVYLLNNTTAVQYADGSMLEWNINDGVVLTAIPVPTPPTDELALAFPAPTKGAVTFIPFIAPKGQERNKSDWKLWGDSSALNGKGALLPSVCPGCLINGNPGPVMQAGGTYSMGIAYLKDNDQTVVSAYYTTISIDAGKGTWKFETPAKK